MTRKELDTLVATVWGEARNQSESGIAAVTHVILNRMDDSRWPDSVVDVCTQRKQFSVWNEGDSNRPKILKADVDNESYMRVLKVVLGVLLGDIPDPTEGANHYHTLEVGPVWANEEYKTRIIGDHVFYRR